MFAGVDLEYKERYILNTQIRRDGSSLFGGANQWANYGRASLAWRASEEPFWPLKNAVNDFKVRAAVGQAGNRPAFAQQYQTFSITNGTLSANTLGNENLRPELSTEVELGFDAEILHKYGLTVTHALGIVQSELLQVPPPASSGFSNQWKNAGQMQNSTWEVSLNVPLIEKRDLQYSARINFDQTKSEITGIAAGIAPYYYSGGDSGAGAMYYVAANVPYGGIYGRQFVENCSQLPTAFQGQCGGSRQQLPEEQRGPHRLDRRVRPRRRHHEEPVDGGQRHARRRRGAWRRAGACRSSLRDSTRMRRSRTSRSAPRCRTSATRSRRTSRSRSSRRTCLLDAVKGNSVWNIGRAVVVRRLHEPRGRPGRAVRCGTAHPLGYYFRAGAPDGVGVGGLYDLLNTNSVSVENASYVKLREVSVGYRIGKIAGQGDWTVSVIGRNLHTWSGYKGYDPETGDVEPRREWLGGAQRDRRLRVPECAQRDVPAELELLIQCAGRPPVRRAAGTTPTRIQPR